MLLESESDISSRILEYESGLLEMEEIVELFQSFMDVGYLSVLSEEYLKVFDSFCTLGYIKGLSKFSPDSRRSLQEV